VGPDAEPQFSPFRLGLPKVAEVTTKEKLPCRSR
jgi:hypothetical protein